MAHDKSSNARLVIELEKMLEDPDRKANYIDIYRSLTGNRSIKLDKKDSLSRITSVISKKKKK
jgi:hypothetical protein